MDQIILSLMKGQEYYLFIYDQNVEQTEILQAIKRYALNPELNFSWYDAAVLSQKVRCKIRFNIINIL